MNESSLVVFLGPMGAGKTTQMRLFTSDLKKKGSKVKVTHIKSGIVGSLLSSFLMRVLSGDIPDKAPIMVLISEKPFFRRVFKLWALLDLFSCSYKFILDVYLPIKFGYVVLAEDYLQSIISDNIYYARLLKLPVRKFSFEWGFISRLLYLVNPMYTIFLDAPTNTLKSRHLQRGDQYEDLAYVYNQQQVLMQISQSYSSPLLFFYVNTDKSDVKVTYKKIVDCLSTCDA